VGHKLWTIVQLFYRSLLVFRDQYESYETKVKEFARERNTPREALRLNSRDLAGLLDFKKLESLRDRYIYRLKDLCHQVFRGQDQTDLLDRYVSDIFHEISILKEEHYNVKTYAPLYEKDERVAELEVILDEAHTGFPKLTRHILFLYQQAQSRMEEHLASFRSFTIFIRSLYLHRDDFVADAYPTGLSHFYRLMYPLGPVEGFFEVGLSFYHAGFVDYARRAFLEALQSARDQLQAGEFRPGTEPRQRLDAILLPLQQKLKRLAASRDSMELVGAGRTSVESEVP
jgi:hypothetical protein